MKFTLSLLCLLVGWPVLAQPEFTLKSGEELSRSNQFGRSTEELEAFIEANPTRLYDQSQALLLISYNHMQLGDFANALAANEASLAIKADLHADDLVNNYVRFGAIHLLRGNHHAALSYLLKAKDYPIEAIQLYAVIDGYLAAAYRGLGQYERAETYYRQSIETLLIEYPEDHPNIITSYYNLGKLYLEWKRPELARRYFQVGLDRITAASGRAFLQALLQNGLGESYADDPQRAEPYHRQALDLATEYFGGYHRETALSSLLLARAIYRQGRRDEAREAILLAIRSLNPEQPNLSWTQLPDTNRLIIDRPLLAQALGFKARWLMDASLPTDERLLPALVNSEAAAGLLQKAMDDRIDQADRMELIPIARQALEAGIQAGVQLWQNKGDANAQQRAFRLAETIKMLQFRAHTGHILQLSGSYAERERELHRAVRLAELQFRLRPLDITVSREAQRLRADYRRLREDWQRAEPLTYQQRYGGPMPGIAQLQRDLSDKHGLLSYFVGEHIAFVFALDGQSQQTFSIGSGQTDTEQMLLSQVAAFHSAIDSSQAELVTTLGYQLYEQLLLPAAGWLKGKTQLSIIPDLALEELPFEALLTETYRKKRVKWNRLPFLIREVAVHYQHMASPPIQAVQDGAATYEFLFLSPVFDEVDLTSIVPNRRILLDPDLHGSSIMSNGQRFNALPTAVETSRQLQLLWAQSDQEGRFKLREAATEQLLDRELDQAHYIHLATYSFVEGASPEETGLILTRAERTDDAGNDGFLLGSELSLRTILIPELLSLDYIERGKTADGRTMPVLPLSGSLMLSGVSNLLYTTKNGGTPEFYPLFYENLLEGRSVVESVQEAQKTLLKQKTTTAPRWWSGYHILSR